MSTLIAAKLEGVSLHYKDVTALDDVSLEIPGGCMAGLIGPDGVGKSSLLALISCARKIQQGRIEVLGPCCLHAARAGQKPVPYPFRC